MGWSSRKEGSSQLKPSPIYLLLRGMEKAGCPQWKWGRELGVSEGAVEESLPLVSSKKAGQCASAPCLGQTGSRSAPRVDNGEGSGGEGVMGRTRGSSQKQFAISVDFQDTAESLLCCGQALFGTLSLSCLIALGANGRAPLGQEDAGGHGCGAAVCLSHAKGIGTSSILVVSKTS